MKPGEAQVENALYVAAKEFNPGEKEKDVLKDKVKLLSFEVGDIILQTLKANGAGWIEGYRASDPDKICGITHLNCLKKINFQW